MASHHHSVLDSVPDAARPQIAAQTEDILSSGPFRTSRQCQDLFRYVIEQSLAGSDESLRERVIGIEVFGRAPDYDTAGDPVVRLRAADVRKRLAQFYQGRKSEPGDWWIEIPTGSYKAQFHPPEAVPAQAKPAPQITPSTRPSDPSSLGIIETAAPPAVKTRFLGTIAWVAGLALLLAVVFVLRAGYRAPTPFDQFWSPVLVNARPVLICTGSNRVYRLSEEARARYRKDHPPTEEGTPNLEVLVPREDLKNLSGQDFIPVHDTYLTIGDASATAQISSLLTSRKHAFDLRFGSDLSFGDLREGSAVLIGAFNNSWTLNMTNELRYVFTEGDTAAMHVQDRTNPSRSWWPKISNGKFSEDYAIVSRILDSKTGNVLVTIAGLDHTGTRAAGDFVTNPQLIANSVKDAPKDWSKKNLQVVLHANVVNGIPGSPTVVAYHFW
jgi:hypothetical protein